MRLKNVMSGFSDFSHNDLSMNEQLFEDYKSKYLDLYERHKHNKESQMESILDDVDFEIELIRTDLINVSYILKLLAQYRESSVAKQEGMKKQIMGIIEGQEQLRSKKELIEAFIDKNLMSIPNSEDIEDEFDEYLEQQKSEEFERLCEDENLNVDEVKEVIETYLYDQRKPFNDDISKSLKTTYPLLQRRKVISRVLEKVMQHIEKFYEL
jgi:type I restriction enzyme, R subunit